MSRRDPSTLAFVIAGFTREWDALKAEDHTITDAYSGELDVFTQHDFLAIADQADTIAFDEFADDFAFVFAYEVAEPLGAWLASMTAKRETIHKEDVERRIRELCHEGCE